jgi:hypothetical protein
MRTHRIEAISIHFLASLLWIVSSGSSCLGFGVSPKAVPTFPRTQPLSSDRFNRDLDERSRRRAEGQGSGEMVAGAVLGTLVAGPFGTFSFDVLSNVLT